jgi:hypothetical protein
MLDHHKSAADHRIFLPLRVIRLDMDVRGASGLGVFSPDSPSSLWCALLKTNRDICVAIPAECRVLAARHGAARLERWKEIAAWGQRNREIYGAWLAMDQKFNKLAAGIAEGAQRVVFNGQVS